MPGVLELIASDVETTKVQKHTKAGRKLSGSGDCDYF